MRAVIRLSAVVLVFAVAVGPAFAKKTKPTPCSGRFLLDAGESLVTDASSTGTDALTVADRQVTIGSCSATASLGRTRKGCPAGEHHGCWKLRARWSSCGALAKPTFAATISYDCKKLVGTLRAKHQARRRFTASLSGCDTGAVAYASTWEAIQKTIFVRHDCANDLCHGSAKQGGLDLRPDVAYANMIQVPSTEAPSLNRIEPGDERRSYLWLKLLAKTSPEKLAANLPPGVQLAGSPMPNNTSTLTTDELEVLRQWIYATAPETGTVAGTQTALNVCLPPAEPITAIPLDPPAPDKGVQFTLPPWKLEAHSQHELCYATYFDFTDKVPAEFKIPALGAANGCFDPNGCFVWDVQTLRQDPQSHHLILNLFAGSVDQIHDPSFGQWTCNGGERDGQTCEPTDLTSCGSGFCRSEIRETFACIGYGPAVPGSPAPFFAIGGAQKAEARLDFAPAVWAPTPLRGILYWNPHAFNLTDQDTMMHGWLNYYFAPDRQYLLRNIFDISDIFGASGTPPYQTQTICHDYFFGSDAFGGFKSPQQAQLFSLSSHTHRHGQHFWVTDPQHGDQLLYENFIYNDPPDKTFDPPLVFNAGDRLHYCALYNNGVTSDGSPDPTLVTRASHVPPNAPSFSHCTPEKCVAGKMNPPASCTTDQDCDTGPGAHDGICDACEIVGGESTENEMFILIGNYFVK